MTLKNKNRFSDFNYECEGQMSIYDFPEYLPDNESRGAEAEVPMETKKMKNYLEESWNLLITVLAKNDEFIPKDWRTDLERISYMMEYRMLPKLISKGYEALTRNGKPVGVRLDPERCLMIISESTGDYITKICNDRGLHTVKDIMLNEVKWEDVKLSINLLDDFNIFGYSSVVQDVFNDNKLSTEDKNKLIEARCNAFKAYNIMQENMSEPLFRHDLFVHFYKDPMINSLLNKDSYEVFDEYNIKQAIEKEITYDLMPDGASDVEIHYSDTFLKQLSKVNKDFVQIYIKSYIPVVYDEKHNTFLDIDEFAEIFEECNTRCVYIDYCKDGINHSEAHNLDKICDIKEILLNELHSQGLQKEQQRIRSNEYEKDYEALI